MKPDEFASKVIDLCAEFDIVEDYDLEMHENVVLRCKIFLTDGFVNIYRNFETDKVAFAWIKNEERIYGADNTGGWHFHPYGQTSEHRECEPVSFSALKDGAISEFSSKILISLEFLWNSKRLSVNSISDLCTVLCPFILLELFYNSIDIWNSF